jgi:hypothetical protein
VLSSVGRAGENLAESKAAADQTYQGRQRTGGAERPHDWQARRETRGRGRSRQEGARAGCCRERVSR